MNKSALYAWGGPGTVRLLKTKYFSPEIDEYSFLQMYDQPFLDEAKSIFGTTDMFVSYSWGFSDETEKKDHEYIVSRLSNFRKRKIHTYGYVQGLNLVSSEFADVDLWCKSPDGTPLPYSKGRKFTCPNNPNAVSILEQRVKNACTHPFFAIFVDNILFGLPPLYIYKDQTSFFGCSCIYCQKEFVKFAGYQLPLNVKDGEEIIGDYLRFRRKTIKNLLKRLSTIVRSSGKKFGINLYDPYWHSAPCYFGYELSDIDSYLDYYLFENHALNDRSIDNSHLINHLKKNKKPSFVVSYRNGIGREAAYSQDDMNRIYTESSRLGYIPCYKATEYTTKGIWHSLFLSKYKYPEYVSEISQRKNYSPKLLVPKPAFFRLFSPLVSKLYVLVAFLIAEHEFASWIFIQSGLFSHTVRKRQIYL